MGIALSSVSLALSACDGGGDGFSNLDVDNGGKGQADCAITNLTPSQDIVKVSGVNGATNVFSVGLSAATCLVKFQLNGTDLPGTAASQTIDSANLTAGNNTLTATSGAVTKSWTIYKNTPPTCGSQTPATSGNSTSPGAATIYTGNATDTDGDPLTFNWTVNGSAAPSVLNVFNASTSSQATFTPNGSYMGANALAMNITDGTDSTSCTWNVSVNGTCTISTTTPTTPGPVRIPFNAGATTNFQAAASIGCNFQWVLNGVAISGASGANYVLASADSALQVGGNVLQVQVTNGTSTDTKTWTVIKNTPPTCGSQLPSSPLTTISVGNNQNFTANGSDLNGDPLTFTWKDNGNAVDTSIYTITPGANSSVANFAPTSSYVGARTIKADITDGYDAASCSWNVQVIPVCQIASSSPSGATVRMSNVGTTQQIFVATGNDPSCNVMWKVNGNTIGAATGAVMNVLSSDLVAGPSTNTVSATYSNGSTTATRTWTVTKNQPPTCGSQTPASTGNSVGVGGNITLAGTAGNPDNDTLSYTWQWNGTSANPSQFVLSSSGNTSTAVFSPTAPYVGTGTASVVISDGYDAATCNWTVTVINSCSIASSFPSTATYKVAYAGTASNSFGVIPNDASCTPTWKLNGSTISTGQFFVPITSSTLNDGPTANTLTLTLDNGITTPTTRTWSVTKNQVPACVSLNPAANPTPMPYSQTKNFTASIGDADGDTLTNLSWRFNNVANGTLFNPVNTVGNTSVATFVPGFSQVGTAQKVSYFFDDGYDSNECIWTFDVTNPNTVQILSCNPASDPVVVYSTGSNSTQTLSVVATNASNFKWYKAGSLINGANSASYAVASLGQIAGLYTYRGIAEDTLGNSQYCDYNVKINSPPTITATAPVSTQTWKLNYGSTLAFSVSATDANNDTLSYTWTMDGAASVALPSGGSSTTFTPNYNPALIGSHTVAVTISDGAESATQSWSVEVNYFSPECNTVYNSPVATAGGYICTLVGVPGMGSGLKPSDDQTLMRMQPNYVIDDGSGNWFISDSLNHTINFWNRSGATITRFNKTIPAGKVIAIVGNGAGGSTSDNVYNNQFKINFAGGNGGGIAYDAAEKVLYIADWGSSRVAKIDNAGYVTSVLAVQGGVGNNLAGNTDGAAGTSHSCSNPADVHIVNYGGNRWLYVTCYSTHTIKRLDILPSSPNYGKAYMVVGRLSSTNTTTSGFADGTLGPTGDAQTSNPWALSDDGNGNIYWTESNSGFRIRGAMTGGDPLTFFGGSTFNHGTVTVTATDLSAPALTAGTLNIAGSAGSGAAVTKAILVGAPEVTGACSAMKVYLQDASSNMTYSAGDTTVTLTGFGAGNVYSDAACTSALPGGQLTILDGQTDAYFYYKNNSNATVTLHAAVPAATPGTLSVKTEAVGTATKLAVLGSSYIGLGGCTKLIVKGQNASNAASSSAASRVIRMSHNGIGNFYTTSNCSGTPTYEFTMNAGQTELPVYYATTMIAPADQTVSIVGNGNSNGVTGGTPLAGATTLRFPRGLAVKTVSGSVQGFFVSFWDQHRINFVNNTASIVTYGGNDVPAYSSAIVLGTGAYGFNTDGLGSVTKIWTAYGISLNNDQSLLLHADYGNLRVRAMDVSDPNGNEVTYIGAGRGRAGHLGDATTPATGMYMNGPSQLVIDGTGRKLYVSDSSNYRIRKVDLLTGEVDTMVGKGQGAATTENDDPTNVFMGGPRGLALMASGPTNFLVYADTNNNGGVGANLNCQIRALNLTPSNPPGDATTFFNVSVSRNKVATIAGDYLQGCQSWKTAPAYGASVTAVGSKIHNAEGIASDGTNLYIAMTYDHCIQKLTPDGTLTPIVGTCTTVAPTSADGSTALALTRYPTGIVVDPSYAADGNFFFTDSLDNAQGRVRYVNYRTTPVTIGSTTVPAATAPNGIVQTIWFQSTTPTSQGRIYGLAAFGQEICYSSGLPNDGNTGAHNVTCYNRNDPIGAPNLRVGPSEASNPPIRGGAPLDSLQENVYSSNAFAYAPYGLGFDAAGNLYIAERSNSIIRMVRRWW
ncbi:MAG: hypothetical protein JST80_01425 [Bdellovibrionales bacterium]|nr:hypothetical protein [Bdellovibrionales bacterium]